MRRYSVWCGWWRNRRDALAGWGLCGEEVPGWSGGVPCGSLSVPSAMPMIFTGGGPGSGRPNQTRAADQQDHTSSPRQPRSDPERSTQRHSRTAVEWSGLRYLPHHGDQNITPAFQTPRHLGCSIRPHVLRTANIGGLAKYRRTLRYGFSRSVRRDSSNSDRCQ